MTYDPFDETAAFEAAARLPDPERAADDITPLNLEPEYEAFCFETYGLPVDYYQKYGIIPLTKGFFTIVSPADYSILCKFNWCASVSHDTRTGAIISVYAKRRATNRERGHGAPSQILLHRYVCGVIRSGKRTVVDHQNGHTLDNRDCNLRTTTQTSNMGNIARRVRATNADLPTGVQVTHRRNGKAVTFRGRIRAGNGKEIRSRTRFTCAERTGRWYERMHRTIHPAACRGVGGAELPPPIAFPPRPIPRVDDIPF
jgi:hypothetical protein